MKKLLLATAALLAAGTAATPANAALTLFQQFTGSVGLSTDGAGSTAAGYSVNAFVPLGATVRAAYLYQTNIQFAGLQTVGLNGNALTFTALAAGSNFQSGRADVTSIVAGIVNGGAGGTYSFNVTEGASGLTDGTALVVVYDLASLATQTVAILDGVAATTGDVTTFTLGQPASATFTGDLRLGIGFSYNEGDNPGQTSSVSVNGTTITANAGNFDDGAAANGALITVGGNDDPFSPLLPTVTQDHERYNIAPYVAPGSTSVTIRTNNPSNNDNIFLAALVVSGTATAAAVPEPATWGMLLAGFGLIGTGLRTRRRSAKGSLA